MTDGIFIVICLPNSIDVKYYVLSTLTRVLLEKLRKYHKNDAQLLVFSKDFIGEEVFAFGVYEKHEIQSVLASLDFDCSHETLLDIGANIGNHAVQFAPHFKQVRCYEPNPLTFKILQINTRNLANLERNNFGLSNRNENAQLTVPTHNVGGAHVSEHSTETGVDIQLKVGDEVISDPFAVIKIDVEGHELEALQGLRNSILEYKPLICFELINTEDNSIALIDYLASLGYVNYYMPHERGYKGNKRKSFFLTFLNGLFFKRSTKLREVTTIDKTFYNLLICEHPESSFRIKDTNIKR